MLGVAKEIMLALTQDPQREFRLALGTWRRFLRRSLHGVATPSELARADWFVQFWETGVVAEIFPGFERETDGGPKDSNLRKLDFGFLLAVHRNQWKQAHKIVDVLKEYKRKIQAIQAVKTKFRKIEVFSEIS